MGNWMNGMARLEQKTGKELTKAEREIYLQGVEWGRGDMLLFAVSVMRDTHDTCCDERKEISGYGMAERLISEWVPSNAEFSGGIKK